MTNLYKQNATEFSSVHSSEVPLQQPMPDRHQSCGDIDIASFMFSPDDSNSVLAEVNLETLNLTARNWNVVLVGESNTRQLDCNCHSLHLHNEQNQGCNRLNRVLDEDLHCDSGPKLKEDQKTTANEKHQLEPDHDGQNGHRAMPDDQIEVDVEPLIPLIKTNGYLNGPQCEKIMECLERLKDNGHFEKHDRLATSYQEGFACQDTTDMELALKIERGVAFSFQKKFKQSKRFFISVINSDAISQLKNPNILLARACNRLVQDYRYRKKTKVTALFNCLEKSEYLLQNHQSPGDWSELYYNYGSLWLAHMSTIPDDQRHAQARNDARRKARSYFEKTIERVKEDPRLRVQIKKQRYGHLRVAALLLDCNSTAARVRKKVIPPEDMEDAIKHLDILERQFSNNVPHGTRAQILKTRSDQYYRQGFYQLAKETAEDALRIASCHGFNTEPDSLQERIDFLHHLCEDMANKERITLLDDSDAETSGNNASCETSGSETEKE